MPKTTGWADEEALAYVLEHEYVHICRFDAVTKLALTSALCVHWFNPMVWIMYVLANRDIELSCDEAVIRRLGERVKSAYAMTLIHMEETQSGLSPLCNHFSKTAIEERIVAIMKIKKTSLAAVFVAMALVVGVTTAFATSGQAAAASSTDKDGTDNTVQAVTDAQAAVGYAEKLESISDHDVSVGCKQQLTPELLAEYQTYGLIFDEAKDAFYFNGKLVRWFFDGYDMENGAAAIYDYVNEDGVVDIRAVREAAQNADGSTDPGGKLAGIKEVSQEEFDSRIIMTPQTAQEAAAFGFVGGAGGVTFEERFARYKGTVK